MDSLNLELSEYERLYLLSIVQEHRDALNLLGLSAEQARALAVKQDEQFARFEKRLAAGVGLAAGQINPAVYRDYLITMRKHLDLADLYRRYAASRKGEK